MRKFGPWALVGVLDLGFSHNWGDTLLRAQFQGIRYSRYLGLLQPSFLGGGLRPWVQGFRVVAA